MKIENLVSLIDKVFDGVPQPSILTLHVANARDYRDYEHDIEHYRKDHIGRWPEIPNEHLKKCTSGLSFIDAIGMRYYLPAYMIWTLKNYKDENIDCDMVLYTFDNHSKDSRLEKYFKERFSLFNDEQMKACALFIKFCSEDTDDYIDKDWATKKYERYWHQYL